MLQMISSPERSVLDYSRAKRRSGDNDIWAVPVSGDTAVRIILCTARLTVFTELYSSIQEEREPNYSQARKYMMAYRRAIVPYDDYKVAKKIVKAQANRSIGPESFLRGEIDRRLSMDIQAAERFASGQVQIDGRKVGLDYLIEYEKRILKEVSNQRSIELDLLEKRRRKRE